MFSTCVRLCSLSWVELASLQSGLNKIKQAQHRARRSCMHGWINTDIHNRRGFTWAVSFVFLFVCSAMSEYDDTAIIIAYSWARDGGQNTPGSHPRNESRGGSEKAISGRSCTHGTPRGTQSVTRQRQSEQRRWSNASLSLQRSSDGRFVSELGRRSADSNRPWDVSTEIGLHGCLWNPSL